MESYRKNGREVYDEFCNAITPNSIMFPRAPEQTYVDNFPGPVQGQPDSFVDERRHQADYETEVVFYRALERLWRYLIVLHSFQYAHGQVCPIRNKKKCSKCKNPNNKEGECDFLVLAPNCCVIIEVKNMSHIEEGDDDKEEKVRALVGTFKKSVEQREKIKTLIKGLDKIVQQSTQVLQFTAYPNFSRYFKEQFQENSELSLSDEELSTVIFKEDISGQMEYGSSYFQLNEPLREPAGTSSVDPMKLWNDKEAEMSVWWDENVFLKVSSDSKLTPEVRNILLAIWSTENNKFHLPKSCLGKCIKGINEQLKKAKITLEPKSGRKRMRTENPSIVKAPDFVKRSIGVEHLTQEQHQAFRSSESFLWVNGPAGAGKSVVLCGKLVELCEDSVNRVVLFRPRAEEVKYQEVNTGNNLYENALKKACVQYEWIKYVRGRTNSELHKLITDSACNVFIVDIWPSAEKLNNLISVMDNFHVFIDDIQELILFQSSSSADISTLMDKLFEISSVKTVRVACDIAQHYLFLFRNLTEKLSVISDKLSDNQITLTRNLRNTRDVSDVLCLIRDMYIESYSYSDTSRDIINMILPKQFSGHFIHGPLVNFHILSGSNQISGVLNEELDKLTSNNWTLNNSDICVLYFSVNESLVKDIVNGRCSDTTDKIAMCNGIYSYSAEWPVVVILHRLYKYNSDVDNLGRLYLQISRARVYCSVITYPQREEGYMQDNKRFLLRLVNKLGKNAHFVRY